MSSDILDPMSKLNPTNKLFIFLLPIGISMSSFVMGYFIVYFTMMEEYIQQYHRYTNEETELYFTLTSTLLPAGAFIGKPLIMQLLSSLIPWSTDTGKIGC